MGHAPSAAPFTMSRMQETFARLAIIHETLEPNFEAVGGSLRVGVYTRQAAVGDLAGTIDEVIANYETYPFLEQEYPFAPAFYQELRQLADSLSRMPRR